MRVHRVGICGTDLHAYRGRQPFFNYPRIYRTVIDVMKLWWLLVIRKEHLKGR